MNGYFDLKMALAPVWQGDIIRNESLLFTPDPVTGETRPCRLLCAPETILRVCSADLRMEYLPDVDYRVENGCIVRLPEGRLPFFSYDEYFLPQPAEIPIASVSCPGRFVRYDPSGAEVLRRQVCVSYTHRGPCPIQPPVSQLPLLPHTAQTLREGRPLTVLFYGDSFMEGCDASGRTGLAPYLPPLDWLVTMALADAYRHPSIRRINTAVGGTTSRWGLEQAKDRLAAYAPELAVIRFGMNDSAPGSSRRSTFGICAAFSPPDGRPTRRWNSCCWPRRRRTPTARAGRASSAPMNSRCASWFGKRPAAALSRSPRRLTLPPPQRATPASAPISSTTRTTS